jgi:protein TonB
MTFNPHRRLGIIVALVALASAASSALAARRLHAPDQVKAPTITVKVNPVYPQAARDAKIEGIVILEVVIGEDGSIVSTTVVRSIPELDQAAIEAVVQWKYQPTLFNGAPVEVQMFVTINFSLS